MRKDTKMGRSNLMEGMGGLPYPWFVAVALVCAAAGAAVVSGASFPIIIGAAAFVGVLALSVYRPEVGLLLIVVLISSVLDSNALPLVPTPLGKVYLSDLILAALLASIAARMVMDRELRTVKSPLNLPMAALLSFVVLSAFDALSSGVPYSIVMRELRSVVYYSIFFVAANLLRERRQAAFMIRGMMFIACAVSAAMVAQAVLGDSVHLLSGRVETLDTVGRDYFGVTRVLPPGQTLVFVMFVTTVCVLVLGREKTSPAWTYAWMGLLGAALVLTFNRNFWAAACLSLVAFALHISKKHRVRLAAAGIAVAIVAGAVFPVMAVSGGRLGRFAHAAADRLSFIYEGKQVMRSTSLEWRLMENRFAVRAIKKEPVFGIGLGNRYRPTMPGEIDNIDFSPSMPRYAHNAYLWLGVMAGMAGLGSLLWLSVVFVHRCLRYRTMVEDGHGGGVLAGFAVSYVGLMAAAVVNPIFMQWFSIIVVALMMGVAEALINTQEKEAVA